MLKRIMVWLVVLCFLPSLAVAAQAGDHLTWTVEELSERVSFVERNDGIPFYKPMAPVEGVALFVTDLRAQSGSEPSRSIDIQNEIQTSAEEVLRFTDDPDQASILLFYEEWNELAGKYQTSAGFFVSAYSSGTRLRMIVLADPAAQPVEASRVNRPGSSISVSGYGANYYEPMPSLMRAWGTDIIIDALLPDLKLSISTADGLKNYPWDIESLEISLKDEDNLRLLSLLTKLKTLRLHLDENESWDLSPLSALAELRALQLKKSNIMDITPLSTLQTLEVLRLGENCIVDIYPLAKLTHLKTLDLSANGIADFASLATLTNLEALYLGNNRITGIPSVSQLKNLKNLSLYRNRISDISALSELCNLEVLDLQRNDIIDISSLARLTNLKMLYLSTNSVADLAPLSAATNLEFLYLGHNEIRDITPLAELVKLEELYLNHNPVTDFSPLYTLTHLSRLVVDSSINSEALEMLQRHLPDCDIELEWENAI